VKEASRSLIIKLIENGECERIPWTFDFGSCKGIQPSLASAFKKAFGIQCSLARYFDYDVWIVFDPDRLHYDALPHIDDSIREKISITNLHGGIPLLKNDFYDYRTHYKDLPEGGFFDGFGLYYYPWPDHPDYHHFLSPLEKTSDITLIKEYPVPAINQKDVGYFKRDVNHIKAEGKMCAAYSGSLYEWSYYLRGREKLYYDFYDNPNIVELIVNKVAEVVDFLTLKNIECGVDILCFFDDLGAQKDLQISPVIFRKFYKPFYKKIWGRIKEITNHTYIFLHSCGNIAKIIPDLIDCGLDILHPIQPETMNAHKIIQEYKKDLVFWGTMSNQVTLTRGTRADIFNEVKERVKSFGNSGKFILGSSNTLGRDVPIENIHHFRCACEKYCKI
jgi:uroporphyrinogen decarboxylase